MIRLLYLRLEPIISCEIFNQALEAYWNWSCELYAINRCVLQTRNNAFLKGEQ